MGRRLVGKKIRQQKKIRRLEISPLFADGFFTDKLLSSDRFSEKLGLETQ